MLRRFVTATAVAACLLPVPARAATHVVALYPAQTGACPPTDSTSARSLATAVTRSTPCPRAGAGASGRQDEQYALAAPPAGTVAGDLTGTVAFAQTVSGTTLPGYLDATVDVVVNGTPLGPKHVVGQTPASGHVSFAVTWPAGPVRGQAVKTLMLAVHWNTGTAPWVEPTFDGSTVVKLPLVTASGVHFGATFAQHWGRGTATCPPGAAAGATCIEITGSATATGLGPVTMRRVVALPADLTADCGDSVTAGTLTLRGGVRVNVSGKGRFCERDGSATYQITITGGTGKYAHARGTGTIKTPAESGKDVWSGTVSA